MAAKLFLINAWLFVLIGTLEAVLWHYTVNKVSKQIAKYLHYPLVAIRCAWFIFVWWKLDKDVSTTLSCVLVYPFYHLGSMYQVRHWLNRKVYTFGFFDEASSSSTSMWDKLFPMSFPVRALMFILGVFFFIIWNCII